MNGVGALRHRVTLQRRATAPDGAGGGVLTWHDIARVWGRVKPLRGMERHASEQTQSPVSHEITVRYREDLTTAMRILWGGRTFNIRSALNKDERKRYLTIEAEENVG